MSYITFISDVKNNEPDILQSVKHGNLILYAGSRILLTAKAPKGGWTHEMLVSGYSRIKFEEAVDAKVAHQWIGSTEV